MDLRIKGAIEYYEEVTQGILRMTGGKDELMASMFVLVLKVALDNYITRVSEGEKEPSGLAE